MDYSTLEKDLEGLSEDKISELILMQGRHVLATISTPGWNIIEDLIRLERYDIEREGMKAVRGTTTKEKGIFHFGEVSGILRAMDRIYDIVKRAKEVESSRTNSHQSED